MVNTSAISTGTISWTTPAKPANSSGAAKNDSASGSDFSQTLADFEKLANENPFERITDAVLKKHGMSSKDFDLMSGPEKDAINNEIKEAMKRSVGADQKGAITDRSA